MKRTGYIYRVQKEECWYARTTITDGNGKRRNIKRRGKDKADAKELLKQLLADIEVGGPSPIDAARMTFNDLADHYESRYFKPAEYRDGRKIRGLRDVQRPLACLKNFRQYFVAGKDCARSPMAIFTPTGHKGCKRPHSTVAQGPSRTGTGRRPFSDGF